jgi:hypothetical protein
VYSNNDIFNITKNIPMATIIGTSLLNGFSGRLGDLVFRTYNGRTVASMRPDVSESRTKKQSPAQAYTRSRFREAAAHASTMMRDPEKRAHYRQKAKELNLTNAYTAALTQYLRRPKVTEVECKNTAKGDVVKFRALRKDFGISDIAVQTVDGNRVVKNHYRAVNYNADRWKVKIPEGLTATTTLMLAITHDTGEVWQQQVWVQKDVTGYRFLVPGQKPG